MDVNCKKSLDLEFSSMKISVRFLLSNLLVLALLNQPIAAAMFPVNHALKTRSADYSLPKAVDLSNKTWSQAFLNMHQLLAHEYALGEHKNINWDRLKDIYFPLIVSAEASKDKAAYYQALTQYMLELHDTHSSIVADSSNEIALNFVSDLIKNHTAGSYGLIINKTNDGQYIASYVEPECSAENVGIQTGAKILTWNNKPIAKAISETDLVWSNQLPWGAYVPSTKASVMNEQARMLVQNTIGAPARVSWINPGTNKENHATLFAVDDNNFIANKTKIYPYVDSTTGTIKNNKQANSELDPKKSITVQWLQNNYVQLKIMSLDAGDYADEKQSPLYLYFVKTMQDIVSKNPKGIIIDLRGNGGGDGRLGIDFAGFFTSVPQAEFYMKFAYYITETQNYQTLGYGYINSQLPYYVGPTVVLTDIATMSAAEWLAVSLQRIGKPVLSIYPNTQGAFCGNAGDPRFIMPENFWIMFSSCRGYDQYNKILVDSNGKLDGGVKTDVLIPFDAKTAIDIYTNGIDRALEFALSYLEKQ